MSPTVVELWQARGGRTQKVGLGEIFESVSATRNISCLEINIQRYSANVSRKQTSIYLLENLSFIALTSFVHAYRRPRLRRPSGPTAIMASEADSLTNCRFYEEKYPEIESFVMVNVKQVSLRRKMHP